MELFEGLKGYEIILAGVAIVVILILVFIMVHHVLQDRSLKYVLPALIIPIVMIAFPAIKKIQFGNSVIETREKITALEANPEDAEALTELEERLKVLEEYVNLRPSTLVTLAQAHAARGDTAAALTYVETAMKQAPKLNVKQQGWVNNVRLLLAGAK